MKIKGLRNILSIVLIITVLFSVVSCSAGGITTFQTSISSQELFRIIISAINDSTLTAESFSSIPDSQKDGVTYSYYYEYISIIRNISSKNGQIKNFILLSSDEINEYIGDYSRVNTYNNLIACRLIYEDVSEELEDSTSPVYIFLSISNTNVPTLSLDWIKKIISIYSYSDYYFNMLDESNVDGLFTLLRPGLDVNEYTDAAVYARASALVDFYQVKVRSSKSQYEITRFLPDEMVFVIPEVYLDDSNRLSQHVVTFKNNVNDYFYITDEIPFYPEESVLGLYSDGTEMVRCGEHYTSADVMRIFGNPINISNYSYDETEVSNFDYSSRLIVNYHGLLLLFNADFTSEDEWDGELVTIRISTDETYTAGNNLRVGMTKSQILEIYPYIENSDFLMIFKIRGVTYEAILNFDEGVLTSIKLVQKQDY